MTFGLVVVVSVGFVVVFVVVSVGLVTQMPLMLATLPSGHVDGFVVVVVVGVAQFAPSHGFVVLVPSTFVVVVVLVPSTFVVVVVLVSSTFVVVVVLVPSTFVVVVVGAAVDGADPQNTPFGLDWQTPNTSLLISVHGLPAGHLRRTRAKKTCCHAAKKTKQHKNNTTLSRTGRAESN